MHVHYCRTFMLIHLNNVPAPMLLSEVRCGMPAPVKDAILTTNCEQRGCVANYRCDVGYVGDSKQSYCMSDGQWTPVSLSCSSMSCIVHCVEFADARHKSLSIVQTCDSQWPHLITSLYKVRDGNHVKQIY